MSPRAAVFLTLVVTLGCPADGPPEDPPPGLIEALAMEAEIEAYRGLCDASAAAWVDSGHIVVAGDEDNVLRVYRVGLPDAVASLPYGDFLEADGEHPEADLEAAAVHGETVYWLASHGRNKNAKPRPNRRRFFATRWTGEALETVGRPYKRLLQDLAKDERYAVFDLVEAARRAPKSPGGLNFEGLAPWPGGALLIGARNPVPDGLALAIPLLNPEQVILDGASAVFGEPLRLDLDGYGVRALEVLGDKGLLIAAGSTPGPVERLFYWSGNPDHSPRRVAELQLNIEGMAYRAPEGRLLLASDDGTRLVGGAACNSTGNVADRSFRVRRVQWP